MYVFIYPLGKFLCFLFLKEVHFFVAFLTGHRIYLLTMIFGGEEGLLMDINNYPFKGFSGFFNGKWTALI